MRIHFNSWGRGRFHAPKYALSVEGESDYETVARSIARKSSLALCGRIRSDCIVNGAPEYGVTLGQPCGDGWTPRAEISFSITNEEQQP